METRKPPIRSVGQDLLSYCCIRAEALAVSGRPHDRAAVALRLHAVDLQGHGSTPAWMGARNPCASKTTWRRCSRCLRATLRCTWSDTPTAAHWR